MIWYQSQKVTQQSDCKRINLQPSPFFAHITNLFWFSWLKQKFQPVKNQSSQTSDKRYDMALMMISSIFDVYYSLHYYSSILLHSVFLNVF